MRHRWRWSVRHATGAGVSGWFSPDWTPLLRYGSRRAYSGFEGILGRWLLRPPQLDRREKWLTWWVQRGKRCPWWSMEAEQCPHPRSHAEQHPQLSREEEWHPQLGGMAEQHHQRGRLGGQWHSHQSPGFETTWTQEPLWSARPPFILWLSCQLWGHPMCLQLARGLRGHPISLCLGRGHPFGLCLSHGLWGCSVKLCWRLSLQPQA